MKKNNSNFIYTLLFILSGFIALFLVWFIYFKPEAAVKLWWVDHLPFVNAILNTISATLLCMGYYFVKTKRVSLHIKSMSGATVTSALFLISYLLYHHYHGDTKFIAQGMVRPIYFAILISHVLLSIVMLPMILITLWNAFSGNFLSHRKWAKWTLPIWLYVSVTGVLIFIFLKYLNF
ncbi:MULTISPECIES: DUF420 domain-containing protein [unclassified Halobacteriovorax]|uniref:DUF420 domain-containing protein n=1 Tax=unclassified Halobacteriovorax TaxID=2639665 RepID=UPI000EA29C24|nr:DUF420 domain-containing protein [Halobacteriovorax sp. BALOs_7]AYF43248.1 PF04238 family protein [Halobacteriovorax sp. BALOs_7]